MPSAASTLHRTQSGLIRRTVVADRARYFLKPWEYRWNTLDPTTFQTYGVLAIRGPDSRPYFNFSQTVWPYSRVGMNWSNRSSRAVETLAVNILLPFIRECSAGLSHESAQQHALALARSFAEIFLLTMPNAGGRIPREIIIEWLQDNL